MSARRRYFFFKVELGVPSLLSQCQLKIFNNKPMGNILQQSVACATDHDYMQMAIEEARKGIRQGHGGPFGSVIVKDGKVVSKGHNMVLANNDATAHGEMMAIRKAGEVLGTFDLSGCTLYTTGEPCHMCLCAILWANIDKVYYGCTIADNGCIGFRDDIFNDLFGGRDKLGDLLVQIDREECLKLFDEYNGLSHASY